MGLPMRITALLVLLSSSGCGSLFVGEFRGLVSTVLTCSERSAEAASANVTWRLEGDPEVVSVATGDWCGQLQADAKNQVASLRQKTCPTHTKDGVGMTLTIVDGTLTALDGVLRVLIRLNADYVASTGNISGKCSASLSGDLYEVR